jgi:hypothetical protein
MPVLAANVSISMSLAQIRSEVRGYLMNTDTNQAGWSDAEINDYINQGTHYIQQLAEFFWDIGVTEVLAGNRDYAAPDNEYQLVRTTFDQTFLPQTNEYELDRDTQFLWRVNPTGTPARFYLSQFNQASCYPTPNTDGPSWTANQETGELSRFVLSSGAIDTSFSLSGAEYGVISQFTSVDGHSHIKFQPDPLNRFLSPEYGVMVDWLSDAGNLSFIYLAIPDTLTLDSHIPQLQETSHPALVYYALMRCFLRDGEFQDVELAQAWWQVFEDWMESVMVVQNRSFPTLVVSAEPYDTGNLLAGRLQSVGPPSQEIVLGNP